MTISVTHDRFKLAQVFTISRGSRSEINVLTVRVTRGGATDGANVCPMRAMAKPLKM